VAGGPGGPSAGPNTSKGKGKVAMPVRSDDEVSSDDDHPLPRRRRLLCNDGWPISKPPPTGSPALAAASTPRPSSSTSVSLVAAPGTFGAASKVAAVSRAAAYREVIDTTVVKKAIDDMAPVERAAMEKRVADVAVEKNAVNDVVAAERATVEAASQDAVESSPAPAVEAKRTIVSGSSTPPAKWRFCGS
jgi:hypothetical protein